MSKTIQDKYEEIKNLGWIECKINDRQAQYTCKSPYKFDNKLTLKFSNQTNDEIWIIQWIEDYNALSVTKYSIEKRNRIYFNHGYFTGLGKHILKGHTTSVIKEQAIELKDMGIYKGDISTKDCKIVKELLELYKQTYKSYNYNAEMAEQFIKAFRFIED